MAIDPSTVGQFIDAVVLDQSKAGEMLRREPGLREARWLHGETVLHFLGIEGEAEHVRLLCEWGCDPNAANEFGTAPLIDVARLGRDDVAAVLLDQGADPYAQSTTHDNVLHCAVRSGNARLVDLLLSRGARADYVTDIGETVLDALPGNDSEQAAVEEVFRRHGVAKV